MILDVFCLVTPPNKLQQTELEQHEIFCLAFLVFGPGFRVPLDMVVHLPRTLVKASGWFWHLVHLEFQQFLIPNLHEHVLNWFIKPSKSNQNYSNSQHFEILHPQT